MRLCGRVCVVVSVCLCRRLWIVDIQSTFYVMINIGINIYIDITYHGHCCCCYYFIIHADPNQLPVPDAQTLG